jgi:hypothetical protein
VSGILNPPGIKINAFWYEGDLVSENTRSLATLSLAGLRHINIEIMDSVPADVLARLTEDLCDERRADYPAARIWSISRIWR